MSLTTPFTDPAHIARYAEETARKVPGLAAVHRMTSLLLAERMPEAAAVLVLGAGGGLELKAFAEAQPHWTFVGIDPSSEMLELARQTVAGPLSPRIHLQKGFIENAPAGPFDGATCLLTLHFLEKPDRLTTLKELHRRLKPGAPLVTMHHCRPQGDDLLQWLTRSSAFAQGNETDLPQAALSAATIQERLPLLSVVEEETLLKEAGFSNIALFYAAFTFRGWVATA